MKNIDEKSGKFCSSKIGDSTTELTKYTDYRLDPKKISDQFCVDHWTDDTDASTN